MMLKLCWVIKAALQSRSNADPLWISSLGMTVTTASSIFAFSSSRLITRQLGSASSRLFFFSASVTDINLILLSSEPCERQRTREEREARVRKEAMLSHWLGLAIS